jgi:hypothetical protein
VSDKFLLNSAFLNKWKKSKGNTQLTAPFLIRNAVDYNVARVPDDIHRYKDGAEHIKRSDKHTLDSSYFH